uniref:WAP domain-containing protein n=1 Tax=Vombatus ursinus TaxID=29139 RepID=A0A4X2JSD8_VOMUR
QESHGSRGKCPGLSLQCLMMNPNPCEHDGDCRGEKKCCVGLCGKICRAPVKGMEAL